MLMLSISQLYIFSIFVYIYEIFMKFNIHQHPHKQLSCIPMHAVQYRECAV